MTEKRVEGTITKVAGPLVVAGGMAQVNMFDVVKVGDLGLIGEVIEIHSDHAYIQVYEETGGIGPGEKVVSTGAPLSVELGPGLMSTIYDGIQRPLKKISEISGNFISRGIEVSGIDKEKKWAFEPSVEKGAKVFPGTIVGMVQENETIEHYIMVPPNAPEGELTSIKKGKFTVEETIAVIKAADGKEFEIKLMQKWPVRRGRPFKKKNPPTRQLVTGQRVIDAFFPIAKGGTACVPGPFGSGKTVIQHQLAKWADAQLIVYVGCGERGNEMTDVLNELPELVDPSTGRSLMEKTILIANTSNMPVAAREASIFTGITIAEYFRDMGYDVALMADSTSRWAEALREMSGRLEEMPGEEGYPAYLGTRIAGFYERSGDVTCLSQDDRHGTLSVIGAVSPPGGDLSDPVVQATLRVVKVFWGLESALAYRRHFPAISWINSYSLYYDNIQEEVEAKVDPRWSEMRMVALRLLQEESELIEIVRLVGVESLSQGDRLTLEISRLIREDFLHQNAFSDIDTYTSFEKMFKMLDTILFMWEESTTGIKNGMKVDELSEIQSIERIARMKYIPENKLEDIDKIKDSISKEIKELLTAVEE
ncbi:V-type ATP synthase subunit A [bacterium]|nr:V-type ATP synthase subunit A [bacterium]